MEIKAELLYPYTEEERINFIVEQNHKLGYEVREAERDYKKINIVEDYEDKEVVDKIEIPDYETVIETIDVEVPYIDIEKVEQPVYKVDEETGETIQDGVELVDIEVEKTRTEQQEIKKEVQIGTHTETKTHIEKVLIGTHEETEIIKVIDLQAWGYTEEEKEQQKKDSIKSLTCTKRVFALILQELGVDYITQLKPLIESNPQAQLEWELCVELLRENPMLDLMAMQLGITPEQLDALFLYANGELSADDFELYKKKEVVDEDTTDADTTDNESEIIDGQDSP